MTRIPTWLILALALAALLRWRRACKAWDDATALHLWRHEVDALTDAQLDALHAALLRARRDGAL